MAIDKTGSQSISIGAEGNLLVMFAPASVLTAGKGLKDITVTQLNSASFVDVTYDLTAGAGWAEATSQETVADDRLTATQSFSRGGKESNTLTIEHVYGDPTVKADGLFVKGERYIAAVRWATRHDDDITATSEFDFWLLEAGAQSRNAPAANSVFTKTRPFYPLAEVLRDQTPASS